MINVIKELKERLDAFDLYEENILWVGSKDGKYALTWGQFCERFDKEEYDNGFGRVEIASDLVVVGTNWWFERIEYDGAEGWSFKKKPEIKKDPSPFENIKAKGYEEKLSGINN